MTTEAARIIRNIIAGQGWTIEVDDGDYLVCSAGEEKALLVHTEDDRIVRSEAQRLHDAEEGPAMFTLAIGQGQDMTPRPSELDKLDWSASYLDE